MNLYEYVGSYPVEFTDPSGLGRDDWTDRNWDPKTPKPSPAPPARKEPAWWDDTDVNPVSDVLSDAIFWCFETCGATDTLANLSDSQVRAIGYGTAIIGGVGIYCGGSIALGGSFRVLKNTRGVSFRVTKDFRIEWHRFTPTKGPLKGRMLNRPHFHRRPGIGLHRPWERGWW